MVELIKHDILNLYVNVQECQETFSASFRPSLLEFYSALDFLDFLLLEFPTGTIGYYQQYLCHHAFFNRKSCRSITVGALLLLILLALIVSATRKDSHRIGVTAFFRQ